MDCAAYWTPDATRGGAEGLKKSPRRAAIGCCACTDARLARRLIRCSTDGEIQPSDQIIWDTFFLRASFSRNRIRGGSVKVRTTYRMLRRQDFLTVNSLSTPALAQ